jgi:sigma-B regulation protein RsbU (phosphoserine phosphatase)
VHELCARIRSILRHRRDVIGEHGRLVDELRSAAEVQRSLLPRTRPTLRTLDCAGMCLPASAVGGDYFDHIPLGSGRLVLMLADVAGKGLPAALLMAAVHGMTRAQVIDDARPERLVQRLNRLLHDRGERPSYATLFCAVYDDGTRRLEYVNAGHPPPLLLGSGQIRALDATCPPVGLFERIDAAPVTIQLHDAERLVMYTDGVTEATSAMGEEFGRDRLARLLGDLGSADAPRWCTAVVDAVVAHQSGSSQRDDVTVLVAQAGARS